MRARDPKPIGLTLSQEYYDRLKAFADSHQWTMALASRIIVKEYLDRWQSSQDGADVT